MCSPSCRRLRPATIAPPLRSRPDQYRAGSNQVQGRTADRDRAAEAQPGSVIHSRVLIDATGNIDEVTPASPRRGRDRDTGAAGARTGGDISPDRRRRGGYNA
jgi:hypothetical protein